VKQKTLIFVLSILIKTLLTLKKTVMKQKHYLLLCYADRESQIPMKKIVLHEEELSTSLVTLLEQMVYVVVEPLVNPE
jgi:hypothetical protein